jgi:hypothetical protein
VTPEREHRLYVSLLTLTERLAAAESTIKELVADRDRLNTEVGLLREGVGAYVDILIKRLEAVETRADGQSRWNVQTTETIGKLDRLLNDETRAAADWLFRLDQRVRNVEGQIA